MAAAWRRRRCEGALPVYRIHGFKFETRKIGTAGHRLVRAMTQEIVFQEGAIEVDARVLARGLGVDVASLQEFMREGKITNLCERGVDNDLGLHCLTFFYGNRRLRLGVGQAGNVIWQSTIDFGDHPLPAAMHKPGP